MEKIQFWQCQDLGSAYYCNPSLSKNYFDQHVIRHQRVFVKFVKIDQFILSKEGDEGHGGAVLLLGNVLPPLLHQPQG